MPCAPQETTRKAFPLNLGGSDTCYFCKKRVYVMERLSAEGHFFHRECFRCSVCATTLRLAAYAFDGEEGERLPPGQHCGLLSLWRLWDAQQLPGSSESWGKLFREPGGPLDREATCRGQGLRGRGSALTWWVLALRAPAECRQLCVRFLLRFHRLPSPLGGGDACSASHRLCNKGSIDGSIWMGVVFVTWAFEK